MNNLAQEQAWREYKRNEACSPMTKKQAARYALGILEASIPGHSVEVRVPFVGAIQVLRGTKHRRGTPPAVVEMSADTWLALASGSLSWAQAWEDGLIDASGERADLSKYLPLIA